MKETHMPVEVYDLNHPFVLHFLAVMIVVLFGLAIHWWVTSAKKREREYWQKSDEWNSKINDWANSSERPTYHK